MFRLLLLIVALLTFLQQNSAQAMWLTDLDQAKAQAEREGKHVLVDFTGSDWCSWCIRLDEEVFGRVAFQIYAKKNLVLCKLDFPRNRPMPAKQLAKNNQISQAYRVRGYPTLVMLNPSGSEVWRGGYKRGGPDAFISEWDSFIKGSSSSLTSKAGVQWLTDLDAAKARAESEGKHLLVDFTGSDWCGWCIRLDEEVFSKGAFQTYAQKNLVLCKLDFPRKQPLPAAQLEKNNQISQAYSVRGYPTLLLLSPNGNEVWRDGYKPGGPDTFIREWDRIREDSSILSDLPRPNTLVICAFCMISLLGLWVLKS
jgi:thioredoxin-related protein